MDILKREIKDFKERKFPEEICFQPIGMIHSELQNLKEIPIQYSLSHLKGMLEIFPNYYEGLKDLEGFSHLICLYFFDMVKLPVPLQSKPFLDNQEHGVFAIRTPLRPNPIGFSIFRILSIKNNEIHVDNIDAIDKTPILDIKPYIPKFDNVKTNKVGWIKSKTKMLFS
ncbi:MAG: tRNA (N6-threonylcarbamoyladenosine(37)-N6)-methyltransferase TrmO [Promethearchaeota archaeon]